MEKNEETVINNERVKDPTMDGENTILQNETACVASEVGDGAAGMEDGTEKKHSTAKNLAMGAVGGIVLGAAGTLFSGASIDNPILHDSDSGTAQNEGTDQSASVHGEIALATSVNDDMSFNEAFAAARHEVGPGGAFVWHGTVYGTYYSNEWNSMSPDEQSQFTHDAISSYHNSDDYHVPASGQTPGSTETAATAHAATPANAHPAVATVNDAAGASAMTNHDDSASTIAEAPSETVEVHVIGHDEGVQLGDGVQANVGYAEVDGEMAVFVDMFDVQGNVGPDGIYDVIVMDANGNGAIEESEVEALAPDSGMTVDNFTMAMEMDNPADDIYASMPDYSNDADVSSLC